MRRPRTHVVHGRWRPQLRFYAHRVEILQTFDEGGALRRFRMPDDRLQAVVADVGAIDVGPGHLRLEVGSPVYDDEALTRAVHTSLGCLEDAPSMWRVRCCYLIPTRDDYDQARLDAIRAWLRLPTAMRATDAAILTDGVDDSTGDSYQCEFGVIEASEAEKRLRGVIGRAAGELAIAASEVETRNLPRVATFLDWNWQVKFNAAKPLAEAANEASARCMSRSSSHSDEIHNMYSELRRLGYSQ